MPSDEQIWNLPGIHKITNRINITEKEIKITENVNKNEVPQANSRKYAI